MEREAVKRGLKKLKDNVKIAELVTDASSSVKKYLVSKYFNHSTHKFRCTFIYKSLKIKDMNVRKIYISIDIGMLPEMQVKSSGI